jgi:uncharacterized protein involved in copper resistance
MTGMTRIGRLLATALAALVLVSLLTPVCAMPDCDQTATATCSDFQPACEKCPTQVVMKHSHDDAVRKAPQAFGDTAHLAMLELRHAPLVIELADEAPEPTVSPPPLDPLGVRLTI